MRVQESLQRCLLASACILSACRSLSPVRQGLDTTCLVSVIADSEARVVFPSNERATWLLDTSRADSMRAPQSMWSLYLYEGMPAGLHVEVGRGTIQSAGDGSLSSYLAQARVFITWPSTSEMSEFDDFAYVPDIRPVELENRVTVYVRGATFARLFGIHRDTVRCDYSGRGVEPVEQYVRVRYGT